MSHFIYWYADCYFSECHYAGCCFADCHECRYAECHYAECHNPNCLGTILKTVVTAGLNFSSPYPERQTISRTLMSPTN